MKPAVWPQDVAIDDPFNLGVAWKRAQARGLEREDFDTALKQVLSGDVVGAQRLGVDRAVSHDGDQPRVTDDLATLGECAQMATDMAPDLGCSGVERVLGDVWLDLDARSPRDRRAVLAALAASCFLPEESDKHQRTPFIQWTRRKPIASVPERNRFRAIDREPHRLCRILDRGSEWTVQDVLDERVVVTLDPSRLAYLLCDDGPALLARLCYTTTGRVATVGWVLPTLPDIATVARWRQVRVWLHRLEARRATVETVMKDAPWIREVIRLATQ